MSKNQFRNLELHRKNYFHKHSSIEADCEIPEKRRKLENSLLDFKSVYQKRNDDVNWQSKINLYLESLCANENINILEWWRDHEGVYLILSKMAKDFLSIMATTV